MKTIPFKPFDILMALGLALLLWPLWLALWIRGLIFGTKE